MPSFQDSAVIFFLALLLFGPKKLPELARQLGKLMGEFRRASNEFRMQMEDELRASEQAEKQKQIAAIEAAAPASTAASAVPATTAVEANTIEQPSAQAEAQRIADSIEDPLDNHPHMQRPDRHTGAPAVAEPVATVPIATSGELKLMPPATGLPVGRSATTQESAALTPVFDSIPQAFDPELTPVAGRNGHSGSAVNSDEAVTHG